jgi:hypothetical protein
MLSALMVVHVTEAQANALALTDMKVRPASVLPAQTTALDMASAVQTLTLLRTFQRPSLWNKQM